MTEQASPLDPQLFTYEVEKYLREDNIHAAKMIIEKYVKQRVSDPRSYDETRVHRAHKYIEEKEKYLKSCYEIFNKSSETEIVKLQDASQKISVNFVPNLYEIESLPYGVFRVPTQVSSENFLPSAQSLNNLPQQIFASKRFDQTVRRTVGDQIWIAKNLRITQRSGSAFAAFDERLYFFPSCSSSLARRNSTFVTKRAVSTLEKALVLPFPYAATNYYHAISEMIFGLRYACKISDTTPIIFGSDHFNIIPVCADLLGIERSRLISASEIEDVKIAKAIVPTTPPFYWDSNFIDFFRCLGERIKISCPRVEENCERIYISRRKSSRSLKMENILEDSLRSRGFKIYHLQDCKFAEQIHIFKQAKCIVGSHGAGFTNIAFCQNNVKIVEIFSRDFIMPDFYHRSKHIDALYSCVVASEGEGYIQKVINEIDQLYP